MALLGIVAAMAMTSSRGNRINLETHLRLLRTEGRPKHSLERLDGFNKCLTDLIKVISVR